MGRIRQKYIKRTAFEAVDRYRDQFTLDFAKNKELVNRILTLESKFLRNKIAGYITRISKVKK